MNKRKYSFNDTFGTTEIGISLNSRVYYYFFNEFATVATPQKAN